MSARLREALKEASNQNTKVYVVLREGRALCVLSPSKGDTVIATCYPDGRWEEGEA